MKVEKWFSDPASPFYVIHIAGRLAFSELKTPTSAKIVFHFDVHPSSMEELQNESGPNIENQG